VWVRISRRLFHRLSGEQDLITDGARKIGENTELIGGAGAPFVMFNLTKMLRKQRSP
jgi:hypothetical protein